jgi:hypothetical protein
VRGIVQAYKSGFERRRRKMKISVKKTIALLALTLLVQSCSPVSNGKTESVKVWKKYKGWNSMCLSNGFAELYIVPQIGGRIVQYKFDDKEFFWVNPQLTDKLPPATGLDPDGGWLNYGGDKLWPAPQGWSNDRQWPGPPDAVLDGQPYTMEQLPADKNGAVGVRLTSRKDFRSGISFSRVIRLHPYGTRVSIEATMTNIDNKPRRWGIWAHTQLDAGKADGNGYNSLMNAFCPINPKSCFPKGYDVIFGEKDNPSFQADYDKSMMKVNYQYRVGKIGMDSDAGWIATIDGRTGDVFIHRFIYEPGKEYPDGSSVEFWHNGIGSIYAYNKKMDMADNPDENPYVFESEILSPFAELEPGQSYTWDYEWFATQVGGDIPIVDCTPTGVICQPLQANRTDKGILLKGRFGIFYEGSLAVHYLDASGKLVHNEVIAEVSPLKAFVLSHAAQPVKNVSSVSLHLYDKAGRDLGQLSMTSL